MSGLVGRLAEKWDNMAYDPHSIIVARWWLRAIAEELEAAAEFASMRPESEFGEAAKFLREQAGTE